MDISKLDVVKHATDGYVFFIENPKTKLKTDLSITVRGIYAEGFSDQCNAALDREKTVKLLADYTIGWGNVFEGEVPIEFTHANAIYIYGKYTLIRNQVMSAMMEVNNFILD